MNHFLDIGANVGNTFDWYLLKTDEYDGWHIWCFEPSPRHVGALLQRCREIAEKNEHSYTITVCSFALSDFTGCSTIFETSDPLGDSLFETGLDRPVEIICGVADAARFIMEMIPEPGRMVLKVDSEGNEIKILDSILECPAILPRIDKMLLEFHDSTEQYRLLYAKKIEAVGIPIEWWKF